MKIRPRFDVHAGCNHIDQYGNAVGADGEGFAPAARHLDERVRLVSRQ